MIINQCKKNTNTKKEFNACIASKLPNMADNPYLTFKNKNDNPVNNAIHKDLDKVRKIEKKGQGVYSHKYHTTDVESIESISKEGLKVGKGKKWGESGKGIFFSDRPRNAAKWQVRHQTFSGNDDIYENKEDVPLALLRVNDGACKNWKYDAIGSTSEYGDSFYCKKNVPKRFIEIRTKHGWLPIQEA